MSTSRWEKIKGRIAPTTVQQLLDHTEEIDQQIEKVLVGLYNDMTDHRKKVAEVSSKLDEARNFSQTIQKLEQSASDNDRKLTETENSLNALVATSSIMQKQIRRIYLIVTIQCVVAISALITIVIR
jgi:SMC interacting uncharacterized protein involved in chromosome segregation